MKKVLTGGLIVLLSLFLFTGCTEETDDNKKSSTENNISEQQEDKTSTMTTSQKNAVKKAEQYLQVSAFSRDGLIEQLEFDKFTTEQATYGVEQNGL